MQFSAGMNERATAASSTRDPGMGARMDAIVQVIFCGEGLTAEGGGATFPTTQERNCNYAFQGSL